MHTLLLRLNVVVYNIATFNMQHEICRCEEKDIRKILLLLTVLEKFKLNGRKSVLETKLVGSSLVGDWRRRLQLAKVRCKIQYKQILKDCPNQQ